MVFAKSSALVQSVVTLFCIAVNIFLYFATTAPLEANHASVFAGYSLCLFLNSPPPLSLINIGHSLFANSSTCAISALPPLALAPPVGLDSNFKF